MAAARVPLKAAGLAVAGVVLIETAARWAIAAGHLPPLTAVGLARVLDLALMAAVAAACGIAWEELGLGRRDLRRGLARGLLWAGGFAVAAGIGFAVLHAAGLDPLRLIRPGKPLPRAELPLFFLVGGVIGPLAEEFFFRGYLFGFLRRWGFPAALVASTAIFTLLHPAAGAVPVVQIVGGLIFATAYEIEKSLIAPAVIHVLGNLAIFALGVW
jgi:membrane protease YdiL (CAAX protease family)